MRSRFMTVPMLATAVLLTGCQQSESETQFVFSCNQTIGSQNPGLCSCIFDELEGQFSDEQMTRISGLFAGNIREGKEELRQSGTESDLDILDRINDVEGATEGCFREQ